MTPEELLALYEEEYLSLDKSSIGTSNRNRHDIASGLRGQAAVREILSKYADEIHEEVVVWNKSRRFTTELDFVAMVNGYMVLVEAKEWFGELEASEKHENVYLSFVNLEGHWGMQSRTNPVYAMGAFISDFMRWMGEDKPRRFSQTRKYIVFTRDDLKIKGELSSSTTKVRRLSSFELDILKLSIENNDNPYHLNRALPSWDYCRDKRGNWFKLVVMGEKIADVPISEIDSVTFPEGEAALIKTIDGKMMRAEISKGDIKTIAKYRTLDWNAVFLKLDRVLHAEPSSL